MTYLLRRHQAPLQEVDQDLFHVDLPAFRPTSSLFPNDVGVEFLYLDVRFARKSGHQARRLARPFCADFVAEVRDYSSEAAASILGTVLTIRSLQSAEAGALTHDIGYARHGSAAGGGRATSFASRRRFCAIAARVNSSCAPHGPRNRSRPSRKMRLR